MRPGIGIEDVLVISGTIMLGVGLWMVNPALALATIGLLLIGFGLFLAGK